MIDVDIRRYGQDKEYQDAVNKLLKGTSSPIFDGSIKSAKDIVKYGEAFANGFEEGLKGDTNE